MPKLLRLILPLAILGLGYLGYHVLSDKEEVEPPSRPAPRVIETEVSELKRIDFRVKLTSQGVVRPHNQTSLTPRVSGQIVRISSKFESGSFFEKDDVLLELDPSDFQAALSSAEARLARAEASLAQEEARAEQALLDWKDLGYTEPPTDLVLRKPQLKEAKANVIAAKAELSDAQRDLERTKILAPYAGRVMERLVGLGQSVSPGTQLGEVFSTDFAEVRLSLSARELAYIHLPNNPDDAPVPVTLTDGLTKENAAVWQGNIVRTEGVLDEKSRKLFIIARVDDPFALESKNNVPLRIGQPIRATLEGELIKNVFAIPRSTLLRPNEIVLIHPEKHTISRTRISPIWTDADHLIVQEDLTEGWFLSTSRLPAAPNGAPVVIITPEEDVEETPKAASKLAPVPGV